MDDFCSFFVFSDHELARLVVWTIKTQTDPITKKKDVEIMVVDYSKKIEDESAGILFDCKSVTLASLSFEELPKENQIGTLTTVILRVDKNKNVER